MGKKPTIMNERNKQNIQPMETTKVIIENWPKDPWIKTWMPVIISTFIALIALGVSLVSVHYTKKEFIRNSRPYVWAINYSYSDSLKIHPEPQTIIFKISNSPSKILKQEFKILLKEGNSYCDIDSPTPEENFVRFPASDQIWHYSVKPEVWSKIELLTPLQKENLERHVLLQYRSLDGGKIYFFKLIQKFIPKDNQWRDIDVQAN